MPQMAPTRLRVADSAKEVVAAEFVERRTEAAGVSRGEGEDGDWGLVTGANSCDSLLRCRRVAAQEMWVR